LAINIAVFVLYEFISKEAEEKYTLVAKQKQYELTGQNNDHIVKIYNEMRIWKHDFMSHMQLVSGMLEKTDHDGNSEAIDYINNLSGKIKNSYFAIVTGNTIVDAIVSAEAALASANGIKFEYNIILEDNMHIDDTELCAILSNLLDNAIEACCKLDEGRCINLEMMAFQGQLSIKIINAADGKYKMENGKLMTTKSGNLHGIGIGHVKSIVERYGGRLFFEPQEKSFETTVYIPPPRQSSN
jgi:sensor histidine kinase regulating citrate/malate metabolism